MAPAFGKEDTEKTVLLKTGYYFPINEIVGVDLHNVI
jgi:hypothetical protein